MKNLFKKENFIFPSSVSDCDQNSSDIDADTMSFPQESFLKRNQRPFLFIIGILLSLVMLIMGIWTFISEESFLQKSFFPQMPPPLNEAQNAASNSALQASSQPDKILSGKDEVDLVDAETDSVNPLHSKNNMLIEIENDDSVTSDSTEHSDTPFSIRIHENSEEINSIALENASNLNQEINIYKSRLKQYPDHPEILFKLATLYHQDANYNLARDLYKQTLIHTPDHSTALHNLVVLIEKLDINEKLSELHLLLVNYPDSPKVLAHLAQAYAETKDFPRGIHYMEQAIQFSKSNPLYYFNLGIFYESQKNFEKAQQAYLNSLGSLNTLLNAPVKNILYSLLQRKLVHQSY